MTAFLDGFLRVSDLLAEVTGRIAAWMFFAVGLFVSYEVFMRYVLIRPTVWVDEVSRIFQIWGAFLAIAYVHRHRAHIFIDLAFRQPGSPARRVVDTFAEGVILFFCAVTVKYGWEVWWQSTRLGHTTDSYLAVPLVWVQSAIWVGFGLMALQSLASIIRIWRDGSPAPGPATGGEPAGQ